MLFLALCRLYGDITSARRYWEIPSCKQHALNATAAVRWEREVECCRKEDLVCFENVEVLAGHGVVVMLLN